MPVLVSYLFDSIININLSATIPISLAVAYTAFYYTKRFKSSLVNVPLATADHFLVKYFGLVPPPNEAEETDTLSRFLIKMGQDPKQYPVSVCWSVTGTPLVFVNSLKGFRDILIDGQAKTKVKGQKPNIQRGELIRLIQNLVFGGLSINNAVGEEWRWRRHILLPSFQPKQLVPKLMPYVARRATQLLSVFQKSSESGEAIELDELFQNLTMDVINYYLYGREDLNFELVGGRTNMKNEHEKLGLGFQSLEAWLPFGINKTNWAQRTFKPARDRLKEFIRNSLSLAFEDYIKALKEYEEAGVPEKERSYQSVAACAFASGQYDEQMIDLTNDLLSLTFAGYDTTAHTLAFTFAELAQNPQLQDDLYKQVHDVLGPAPISPESITADKLARMPLVTAVYRETLRKYPAVVFIPVHVNRDTVVDGVVIPGGAEAWCNVRGIQMNPAIFPNPEIFDPTRWLRPEEKSTNDGGFDDLSTGDNGATSTITAETQYNFPDLTFTLGPHSCLGKNLAILELRTVIACVMNEFTLKLKEGAVIDTNIVLTTKPRHGVWVHLQRRQV